jgi:subtilase family serine protease
LWLLVVSFISIFAAKPSLANASLDHPKETTPATVRLPGHVLSAIAKASVVPSSAKSESGTLSLTLVLKRDDQAGFERFLHDLYDPKSPAFHHFLTQQQIGNRFGPSRADYNSVLRWMGSKGSNLSAARRIG